jgi:hypothetical protein
MTVSPVGTTFFATARFDLALVTRFLGVALALVRFVAFPRVDLAGLRALPRVAAFPLRAATPFFR